MRRTFILPLVAAALCLSSGSAAQAADCASTLGPESSFGGGTYGITGTGAGPGTQWAFAFTPSVDCQLGTVEVAFHLGSGTNGLRISVFEDNGGLPTGTLVESTTVLGAMTSDPGGSLVMGVFSGATQ